MLNQRLSALIIAMAMAGPVHAQGIAWDLTRDFKNKKAREDISGASCPSLAAEQDWCIVVNDKKKYVQTFTIRDRLITPGHPVRVMNKKDAKGRDRKQADIEGIARDGGYVYLTGSHGRSRTKGRPIEESRFRVYRLPVNAATGKPAFKIPKVDKDRAPEIAATNALRNVISTHPVLHDFDDKELEDQGVTIEGLGARNGQLFFGFRAPVDHNGAFILEVAANDLFAQAIKTVQTHRLQLGKAYGIRAIERFRGGFLVLAGKDFGTELPPVIWLWAPGRDAIKVATLDVPNGWKAEGLALLSDDTARGTRVLVLFDGQKNGHPMEFMLPIK